MVAMKTSQVAVKTDGQAAIEAGVADTLVVKGAAAAMCSVTTVTRMFTRLLLQIITEKTEP